MKNTNIYFSPEIRQRLDKDGGYMTELGKALEELAEEHTEPLARGEPRTVGQAATTQGRIYITAKTYKRKADRLTLPAFITDIYFYGATEYEQHKEGIPFILFEDYMRGLEYENDSDS